MNRLGVLDRYVARWHQENTAADNLPPRGLGFVKEVELRGGQGALDSIREIAKNERDEKVRLVRVHEEMILLLADFRISEVVTSGPSQCGKTLCNTLVFVDAQIRGGLNGGWFYDTEANMNANVPLQYQPIANHYWNAFAAKYGLSTDRKGDRKLTSRYQFLGANAIFTSVLNSSRTKSGKAATAGNASSWQADYLNEEERSQWPSGIDTTGRLEASRFPSKPVRPLGTPGGGEGIERIMANAKLWFYPHARCPHCNQVIKLDPKGCVLRPFESINLSGESVISHITAAGRPHMNHEEGVYDWFHRDSRDPIDTAFIGCPECGEEIPDKTRYDAWLQCILTGITASDYLASIDGWMNTRVRVAIQLSPLIRYVGGVNTLAADLIRSGLDTDRDSAVWQQEKLGHPSVSIANSLTLPMLRRSWESPRAKDGVRKVVIAGIDQGRSQQWIIVCDYFLQEREVDPACTQNLVESTPKNVVYDGAIYKDDIPGILDRYGVDFGLIDNEPEREWAARLCRETCMEMADQRPGLKGDVKASTVPEDNREHPCWLIHNDKFLRAVLNGFILRSADGHPLTRVPEAWADDAGIAGGNSAISQMLSPRYDPVKGKWIRAADHNDHRYYAMMFVEAAFAIWVGQNQSKSATPAPQSMQTAPEPFLSGAGYGGYRDTDVFS